MTFLIKLMAENNPLVVAPVFTLQTFLVATLAGGFAGTSIDLVLFPVDTLKTRLQASSKQQNFKESAAQVSKFRGLASSMAASFPCAATFWLSYEFSKYQIRQRCPDGTNIHLQHILASSIAETCQAVVRCPFEVVKQNMQIGSYASTLAAVRDIH
jgi:solute carrier family 25 S-adenosylmethionine transporter 26